MGKIIVDPNTLTKTVEEAVQRHCLIITEEASAYVEGVIKQFFKAEGLSVDLGESVRYAKMMLNAGVMMTEQLKDLGDLCLFLSGYFYDRLRKKGKSEVKLYAEVGSSAYSKISNACGPLYTELSNNFSGLVFVISDLRLTELDNEKKLLDIYRKWEKTNDIYYLSLLLGKGINPQRNKDSN